MTYDSVKDDFSQIARESLISALKCLFVGF